MTEDLGDVVCVGLVPSGQVVDWAPSGPEPDPVEWVPEGTFADIVRASAKTGVPVFPTLDVFAQTRIGRTECMRILMRWGGVEAALKGTPAEVPRCR